MDLPRGGGADEESSVRCFESEPRLVSTSWIWKSDEMLNDGAAVAGTTVTESALLEQEAVDVSRHLRH